MCHLTTTTKSEARTSASKKRESKVSVFFVGLPLRSFRILKMKKEESRLSAEAIILLEG